MKTLKYMGGPLIIAILATICQVIDQLFGAELGVMVGNSALVSGGWIAFIGWACYFLAGCDIKGGTKVIISTLLAIFFGVAINFLGATAFSGLGFWAFPVVILILVTIAIPTEKIQMNILPVLFITCGVFFGMAKDPTSMSSLIGTGVYELVYIFFGCVLGWLTILIRGGYDAKYNG